VLAIDLDLVRDELQAMTAVVGVNHTASVAAMQERAVIRTLIDEFRYKPVGAQRKTGRMMPIKTHFHSSFVR
jgi:hypothetical protein